MDLHKVYNQIKKEFNAEIALDVVSVLTINLTTKISKKDYIDPSRYTRKLIKKARRLLWEASDDHFELVRSIWEVMHEWDISHALGELEEGKSLSIKTLIEKRRGQNG